MMKSKQSRRRNFPTVMVLFGATGDLAVRKILPALWTLFEKNELPPLFSLLGFSRRPFSTPQYQNFVKDTIRAFHAHASGERLEQFIQKCTFISGSFDQARDYATIGRALGAYDGEWKTCANKLFYLAVAPEFYSTICKELSASHLTDPCGPDEGWTRVLVEKPFGKDLRTAEEVDLLLAHLFKEHQIYRIDHYLAKEMIQNILTFRFANDIFEHQWNASFIEKITIRVWETLGVEARGAFYDGVGALRDVGQNHLLQMLAFITMSEPDVLTAETIRAHRAAVLETIIPLQPSEMAKKTIRAQYHGYRSIEHVDANSQTETYFSIVAELGDERFRGVPIVIESGKRMGERRKEIVVEFRHPSPCSCPEGEEHRRNRVVFSMEPHEGITIEFWSKKPGLTYELERRKLTYSLREETHHVQYVEEYQKLLIDCIEGDQTLFVSTDEMKAMWRFVDPISMAWQKNAVPLLGYTPDNGVAELRGHSLCEQPPLARRKEIGLVGLGKMGANLARRLHRQGWRVVAYNRTHDVAQALANEGVVEAVTSYQELARKLPDKRLIWLMIPAGKPVDDVLFGDGGLVSYLSKGDTIIDGGNSKYTDDVPRAKRLKKMGINFMDVGTSGGPEGALHGPCLMIGGTEEVFTEYEHVFRDIAGMQNYAFFKGIGAGHFVKMVHNGIEYGMMQSIAEGMAVMKKSSYRFDLERVARIYQHGSVIASRLVGWLVSGFKKHGQDLKKISGTVAHTGEGAWTVETAKKMGIPVPIIEGSLRFRKQSAKKPGFVGKVLSMLRGEFGGHATK